jgi:hypothetical protein
MPYNKRKQKCTQSDGDKGSYVLSYATKKGDKRSACHTSKKKMQGQIAAIEAEADESDEEVLEETLKALIREVIVNFDGEEYDIPRDEVESIRQRLEMGYVGIGMKDEPDDRTFDLSKTEKRIEADFGDEKGPRAAEIIVAFDDGPRGEAVKIIANNTADVKAALFSQPTELDMKGTLPSSPAWIELGRINGDGLGRMEIALSLYLQNVVPDGGGGAHDLNIGGVGETHVKDQTKGFSNPDARMGKQINNSDRAYPWFSSIVEAVPGWEGKDTTDPLFQDNSVAILNAFAKATGSSDEEINTATIAQYDQWADAFQENIRESFFASESWGEADALMFTNSKTGQFFLASKDSVAPRRLSQGKWRVGITSKQGDKFSRLLKQAVRTELKEHRALRSFVSSLLTESLDGSDKSEIKRMIKKELEGPTNRREVDKAFKKNFDKELRKALGVSFFGTPGKINKFVIDEIQKEVIKSLDSKASKDVVIFVCKEVIKKLYRELSFSSPQIIDRINPKV